MREENRVAIKGADLVAYISVDPRGLYERTRYDKTRPLLQGVDPQQKLRELHAQRDPLYRDVATIIVDGNRNNARQIVDLLVQEWNK